MFAFKLWFTVMSIGCFMMLAAFVPSETVQFTAEQVIGLFAGGMVVLCLGAMGMNRTS